MKDYLKGEHFAYLVSDCDSFVSFNYCCVLARTIGYVFVRVFTHAVLLVICTDYAISVFVRLFFRNRLLIYAEQKGSGNLTHYYGLVRWFRNFCVKDALGSWWLAGSVQALFGWFVVRVTVTNFYWFFGCG